MTTGTDTPTSTEVPVLEFPGGIPGLPDATNFVLEAFTEDEEPLFSLLRSVDDTVSLIVTQPWLFFPEYAPDLPDDQLAEIGITSPEDVTLFCPVTLDQAENCVYVNLVGPFVVNVATRTGRQIVLSDGQWPLRARVDLEAGSD